ncbi:Cell surface protein (plasmid) [Acidisarcina polymorpha]|uniref:Cell surface protein n=1 Tax=Acidisarcina polymorpha TaxID=2211140 RepID=A0A2Z5GAB6_9BACT|nr:chitobiase/beta-hexosaminidase C-terminal domain-containing protein [Acidisarcina polymorpha]AXC16192.1 Cell surface protein [Acidisarcina polymorpha]
MQQSPKFVYAAGISPTLTQNVVKVGTPTFSPLGGVYPAPIAVTLSLPSAGAMIYYTTNGAIPTTQSALYTAPIAVSQDETIQAIAALSGGATSAVGVSNYTINSVAVPTTTSIQSSVNPSPGGEPITFTATVTTASGPASGTVTFSHGAVAMGTITL